MTAKGPHHRKYLFLQKPKTEQSDRTFLSDVYFLFETFTDVDSF